MADKLTGVRIKYDNNTYSNEIPITASANNITWDNSHGLIDAVGNVNFSQGSLQQQINNANERITKNATRLYAKTFNKEDLGIKLYCARRNYFVEAYLTSNDGILQSLNTSNDYQTILTLTGDHMIFLPYYSGHIFYTIINRNLFAQIRIVLGPESGPVQYGNVQIGFTKSLDDGSAQNLAVGTKFYIPWTYMTRYEPPENWDTETNGQVINL